MANTAQNKFSSLKEKLAYARCIGKIKLFTKVNFTIHTSNKIYSAEIVGKVRDDSFEDEIEYLSGYRSTIMVPLFGFTSEDILNGINFGCSDNLYEITNPNKSKYIKFWAAYLSDVLIVK